MIALTADPPMRLRVLLVTPPMTQLNTPYPATAYLTGCLRQHAANTVEVFSARLRDEVDLDTLSAELLAVVDQTMQPTTASLWLRESVKAP